MIGKLGKTGPTETNQKTRDSHTKQGIDYSSFRCTTIGGQVEATLEKEATSTVIYLNRCVITSCIGCSIFCCVKVVSNI